MAKKRSAGAYNDDLPDLMTFLSCPFYTEEQKRDMYRQVQEMVHGPTPEPMPKTLDSEDLIRAHALGVRLDGDWPN